MKEIDLTRPSRITKEVVDLINASYSGQTRQQYTRELTNLYDWLNGRKLTDETLSDYLASLHHKGLSPASCSMVVAAVNANAKLMEEPSPVGPVTTRTLAGVRRKGSGRGRGQMDGLRWEDVEVILKGEDMKKGVIPKRNTALLSVMSDAMLRASEVVALRVNDVISSENGTGLVRIRRSKTDQEGVGAWLFLGPETLQRVRRYCIEAGIRDGALFRRIRRGGKVQATGLTTRGIQAIVARLAKDAGFTGRFSSHSLRIGSAQSLVERGATLPQVQQAGRWASPGMVAHYVKGQVAAKGAIARFKYGDQVPFLSQKHVALE
ncbi:MAG: tyrosine-type recombinase/integrase [Rhodothermaceae bacterium]|nr:tyrosine-type recombinase/integrase [Rhodothermaceae bacterium]MXX57653.1 tyrosine-type recombinase/integrase [Rhodothermaceae bacterium]MYD19858.1 tyrosine-type recombinase/integrase [Rhodothermaceae bacterium]MYD57047.1 tyrosine-type recombinase/integrase [Rhodothermaceae bacterium]MYI44768.1 tyrosine-type recombinase/integrase [Rhodothermaceae bacterium]